MNLASLVAQVAREDPDAVAVEAPDGSLTYGELDAQAAALAAAFEHRGIRKGDRIGLWLPKSRAAVVAMQAALRVGAIYVPIDPEGPWARAAKILDDCDAAALVVDDPRSASVGAGEAPCQRILASDLGVITAAGDVPHGVREPLFVDPEDLAYILYTSGSTGTPKGVSISHRAALAFVRWAHDTLDARTCDRFASHAPFHFDLSVLDLYAAFMAGARVCLIPEGMAYAPTRLVEFIERHAISIWYSVPSALMLMLEHGRLLESSAPPPRAVLFAGESFPIKHLRRLWERFGSTRFLNLYGPTETNVCTYHEVGEIEPHRTTPVPIGRPCCGDEAWAVTAEGKLGQPGDEGELWVRGPTVMSGYWGHEPQRDAPYATGDIVRVLQDGGFEYVGRCDDMVKVRGHRIDLGEIEAALLEHPDLHQVACVVTGHGLEARIEAFVRVAREATQPSLLALKRHCAERLPRSMVIDSARAVEDLPRNRNGKIDRRSLVARSRRNTR